MKGAYEILIYFYFLFFLRCDYCLALPGRCLNFDLNYYQLMSNTLKLLPKAIARMSEKEEEKKKHKRK